MGKSDSAQVNPDDGKGATRHGRTDLHSAPGRGRLRAPKHHGESLQDPPLANIDQIWESNLQLDPTGVSIDGIGLKSLQRLGRAEVIEMAIRYSRSYLDIEREQPKHDRVIMSGHQPELFHPGVWYKNFVASELGRRFGSTAINLVVDNDLCTAPSIRVPKVNGETVRLDSVPMDCPGGHVPYESRRVDDLSCFRSFGSRAASAIEESVPSPLVNQVWPHVMEALARDDDPRGPRLGHTIAAGRHRFENEIGLETLEVPVSWIAQSVAFARFAAAILLDLTQFQTVYALSLKEYRVLNRIRSRSHPVPDLDEEDGWQEAPFWIWQKENPHRRRLFARRNQNRVALSDRDGWRVDIEIASFHEEFLALAAQGVSIRPRALMTTMFSRLILSDLFLHGIGGAKYDQLTDVIAQRFFEYRLPEFATLSVTMKLPIDFERVGRDDIVRLDQHIRDLQYHPERFVGDPAGKAFELVQKKREWTQGELRNERSKARHDSIGRINRDLQAFVSPNPDGARAMRERLKDKVRASDLLGSREYSFCLFPESLVDDLWTLM